jgi:hypothetical protein
MNLQKNAKRGVLYAFIPNCLEINGRPELAVFPFNVVFAKYKKENGQTVMGAAVYEPDLASLKKTGEIYSMEYNNIYGGKNWLVIEYDANLKSYLGNKYVNGKSAGQATGIDWKMFFVHFTALGLSSGEQCESKPL